VLDRPQRGEHRLGIGRVEQLDRALQDDRAAVHLAGLDVVHRRAEDLDAVGERLLDGVQSRERGQQRRVHVHHAPREAREEGVVEDRHVAGEDDEPDVALVQPVADRRVARRAVAERRGLEHPRRHARSGGTLERPGAGLVRRDRHHLDVAPVDGVEQRLQVGPLARGEHPDPRAHAARAAVTRSFG
jgi:hypothetical protein